MRKIKKQFSAVVLTTAVLSGISVPGMAETVHEEAIHGWDVVYADSANGSVTFDTGVEEKSVAVSLNSNGGEISVCREIETVPGKKYEVIAKIKTKDNKGAFLFGEETELNLKIGTSAWSEYRMAFTASAGKSTIGIKTSESGSVIVDELKVKCDGKEIVMENSDFEMSGEETTSSTGNMTNALTDKESYTADEIPALYSASKKVPLFYAENIKIDGDVSDWDGYPYMYMPSSDKQLGKLSAWDGEEDLSADVYMAYDEESLYFMAKVTDDVHEINPEIYWAEDCLQLGFTDNGSYGPEIGLFFDEYTNYIDSPIGKQEEMSFVGKRVGNVSIYEYSIPWKTLYSEKPEEYIVFNVLANDGDKGKREAFIEWTDGIGWSKSPDSITMQFVKKENNTFGQWIDGPGQIVINETGNFQVNLFNRDNKEKEVTVKIPSAEVEKSVTVPQNGVLKIPFAYRGDKVGYTNLSVSVEGETTSYSVHQVKVVEKDKYQNLDLTNIEGGKLAEVEKLIEECKAKGISTVYEELNCNIIKLFTNFYYSDMQTGYTERGTYVANNLERIADETIATLKAYLDGSKEAVSVPIYQGGDYDIKGYNLYADTKDSLTGEEEYRPVFFLGYGHTSDAMGMVEQLPKYGSNSVQFELGVYQTVKGYSSTPDAENIMDRFIFTDATFESNIVRVMEKATQSNQAVDLILSPHYFPNFVRTAHPDATAPNQGGMLSNVNIYHEKVKEVIEAHIRYFLGKIKERDDINGCVKSICLTNEPAFDVRNVFELGNMDNTVTCEWIKYLEEKYVKISALNRIYGSDYSEFDEVPLIETIGANIQTYDWFCFNNKMFADWHKWMADIVKEEMPGIPVHTKIMNFIYANSILPQGTDHELFAEFCEMLGNDAYFCYPTTNPVSKFQWYDFQASMKEAPVYDSESHIITDGDDDFIKEHAYQNSTDMWMGATHGRALTNIWVWGRMETAALAGSLLFRPDVVQRIGRVALDLNRCSYEVAAINEAPYKVGVMYSYVSRIYDPAYINATDSAYKGSIYTGEKTRFITEKQLANRDFRDLDIIIVPYAPNVLEETVSGLREFIERGGKVFVMGGTSLCKNENDEKIHSDDLKFLKENVVYWDKDRTQTPTYRIISGYLSEAYKDMEDIGEVMVYDAESGELIDNAEWRSVDYDGHKIINICNYTWEKNNNVYITVNGRRVKGAYDLKNCEELNGYITLNSFEPRLIRVDELSDIEFTDISGHWAKQNIEKMTLMGILNGVSNTEFMPDREISAHEFLAALMRMNGIECEYQDVISKSAEIWDINGEMLNKNVLTREDAAVLICKAMNIENENSDISFKSDSGEISEYAYDAISALYGRGVMTGKTADTINPKDVLTRAEAVTLLSNLLQ